MKTIWNNLSWTILIVTVLGGTSQVSGTPLTFYFEGEVRFVHDSLDLDETVFVGAPFTGGYTFDPTGAKDSYPDAPATGNFYFGPPARLWARIGNYEFATSDLIMFIVNDPLSGDLYEPISVTPFAAAGYQWSIMSIVLADWSGTALDSDALPTGVPELSDFPDQRRLAIYLPGDDLGIGGTLTSLTPEPTSVVMLALGAVLTCRRGKR